MRSPSSLSVRRLVTGGVGVVMAAALTFAGAVPAEAADTSCSSGLCKVTFSFTGASEAWTVPSGVENITAVVMGGAGGHATKNGSLYGGTIGAGGLGGAVRATIPVHAGDELKVVVGGDGQNGVDNSDSFAGGGYGGGGAAGKSSPRSAYASGGGGGGSFLFDADTLLVAAGGGGGASVRRNSAVPGGAGGSEGAGSSGGAPGGGDSRYAYSGSGATTSGPGAGGVGAPKGGPGSSYSTGPDAFALGGGGADNRALDDDTASGAASGAGGGGGFFGGGGGATDADGSTVAEAGAGGGGSGFVTESAKDVRALDGNSGNGSIVITYDDPNYATTIELKASDNANDATATELTATVSPATATGSVTFTGGGTELGSVTLTDGTATLLNFLSAGSHTITASYSGDSAHGPSSTQTTVTVTAYTAPSFSIDSSTAQPIEKSAVAGERFSFADLNATGTPTPTYKVTDDDSDSTVLPDGVSFTDGVLTGTSARAGTWQFAITAINGRGSATEHIRLTITPGRAAGLEATVSPGGTGSTTGWAVAPDGAVTDPSDSAATKVTANQGDTIVFRTTPVDQYGNPTTDESVQPVTTSSVDTDTITYDPATNLTTVTFNHASPHVIAFTVGGLTNSFTVQVTPAPSSAPNPAPSAGNAPSTGGTVTASGATGGSSQLATTGSAPLAPVGWALATLAAGIAVTLIRRRRTARRID